MGLACGLGGQASRMFQADSAVTARNDDGLEPCTSIPSKRLYYYQSLGSSPLEAHLHTFCYAMTDTCPLIVQLIYQPAGNAGIQAKTPHDGPVRLTLLPLLALSNSNFPPTPGLVGVALTLLMPPMLFSLGLTTCSDIPNLTSPTRLKSPQSAPRSSVPTSFSSSATANG